MANTTMEFRLHKVVCVDETGGTDFGIDEIVLSGLTVDAAGCGRKRVMCYEGY